MAFKQFLEELYEPLGGVTVRSMFGGLGVFKQAVMFGLVFDDVLYLRADEATAGRYADERSPQFIYKGMKGREVTMPYYRLPDRLYDDADEFIAWSNAAFAAAMTAATLKVKGQKSRGKTVPVQARPAKKSAPANSAQKGR